MKRIIILILLIILNLNTVVAEENTYQAAVISNQEYTILYQTSKVDDINQFYEDNINLFDNLIILKNDEVIKMEYGLVSFNISNSCNINVEYLNVNNRTDGYVNGCYGRDAAYIKTNDSFTTVDFIQSGTYGRVDLDEVELFPLENIKNISAYEVIDDQLIHEIKGNLEDDKYISMINLGDAPIYLNEGNFYYSFDSHYFYTDIKVMLNDYINLNYDNAINVNNPYYNYYMYLSHRSISNYNIEDLKSYFNDYLLIDSNLREFDANFNSSISDIYNQSQYNNKLEAFIQYQYQFGANSLMMLSLSMNETASGRSSLSFRRNNLFGHAAYDSDVEANARRYISVENSIYSHAKTYISKTYLNTEKFQYHGGFFGNKESGMNVSYASDPYWGEKASSYFYQLDKQMGLKDYNNYCIGISNDFDEVNIYNDKNDVIYTSFVNNMSFVLIEEVGSYYRIQYEESFDKENYNYDFESNYAYVLKEDIDIVLNRDRLEATKVYKTVVFDANGGLYNDGNSLVEYKMLVADIECAITPSKEGYLFINYDENNIANYSKIKNISLSDDYQKKYYLNDKINLNNILLTIETENQTISYPVDSTMVDQTQFNELGEQLVTINLQNNLISFMVNVEAELDSINEEIYSDYSKYFELADLKDYEISELYATILKGNYYEYEKLNFNEIRLIDSLAFKYDNNTNYILNSNDYDISVSGLVMSVYQEKENNFINDNVFLNVIDHNDENLKNLVVNNGYDSYNQFSLQLKRNSKIIDLNQGIIVSIKKPEGFSANQIFIIFEHVDDKFIKLQTTQSDNYINFKTEKLANYIVASVESINSYSSLDKIEVLTINSSEENSFVQLYQKLLMLFGVIIILLLALILNRKKRKI